MRSLGTLAWRRFGSAACTAVPRPPPLPPHPPRLPHPAGGGQPALPLCRPPPPPGPPPRGALPPPAARTHGSAPRRAGPGARGATEQSSACLVSGHPPPPAPPERRREHRSGCSPPERPRSSTEGSTTITFGRHRGMTYDEVVAEHPDYCSWALRAVSSSPGGGRRSKLSHFVGYLQSTLTRTPVLRGRSPLASSSSVVRYSGRCTREKSDRSACTAFDEPEAAAGQRLRHSMREKRFYLPICHHGEPTLALRVKKSGPTHGRWFYACARTATEKCDFFEWGS